MPPRSQRLEYSMARHLPTVAATAGIATLLALLAAPCPSPATEDAPTTGAVPPGVPAAAPAAQAEIRTDLRSDYLAGYPLNVGFEVHNPGVSPLVFPDLQARPHLVRFELKDSAGRTETRYTTPPTTDPASTWTIAPRTARHVLLEIPSGAALSADHYDLTIHVQVDGRTITLPRQSIHRRPTALAGASLYDDGLPFRDEGWMLPWLQKTTTGVDLYLEHARTDDPTLRPDQWWLASLPAGVLPALSASQPQAAWNRHLTWTDASHSLWYTRLQAQDLRYAPRKVGLPWPSWHLLARGATDGEGWLHVPVWIDQPSGKGGEVRLVTLDERGQARFRQVVTLPSLTDAAIAVDTAGQIRLGLLYDGRIDLYTVRAATPAELPAGGRRIFRPAAPKAPTDPVAPPFTGLALDYLAPGTDGPGGLALFAWSAVVVAPPPAGDASVPAVQRISGSWFSLEGREIKAVEGVEAPSDARVRKVLPGDGGPLVVLLETARGKGEIRCASWDGPVPVADLGASDTLFRTAAGQIYLLQPRETAGIGIRRVTPPVPANRVP